VEEQLGHGGAWCRAVGAVSWVLSHECRAVGAEPQWRLAPARLQGGGTAVLRFVLGSLHRR